MKNITKFLTAAFIIGVFCTINLSAQENEKPVGPVKGAVIKGGKNGQVTFCWSADENAAASYRLKVWQLMQGQSAETAMKTKQPIITKSTTVVNNKNPELMRNTESTAVNAADSEAIKACSESLQPGETAPPMEILKTRTKSNQTNERQTAAVSSQPEEIPTTIDAQKTKTKSNNANDRQVSSQPEEISPTTDALKTRTKSNNTNERQTATNSFIVPINVDNFPACAEGTSCDYVFTVEALNADGNPLNPNAPTARIVFGWNVKTIKK